MDFFEHQEKARKQTGRLVLFLGLAITGIIAGVYVLILLMIGLNTRGAPSDPRPLLDLQLLIPVALGVGLLVLLGSLFKTLQLRGGGARVAESLGGRLLTPDASDPDERKVLNVVEEMAIASGIPPPPVYLIPEPQSINAFAAGWAPEKAVIGVTEGAVKALNRDELQGVIAHEFSHIFNGDMRLNIRLIGILHGILLLALLGQMFLRGSAYSSNRKNSGGGMALGLGLLVIGYIGVFFGHLIKSAVSRQREYLADASAVQFTRNPDGIAGALAKIGGLQEGSRIRHPKAEMASHMFFCRGLGRVAFSGLATHPPLQDRIRRIQPAFDGTFPSLDRQQLFKLEPSGQETPAESKPSPADSMFPPDIPIPDSAKAVLGGVILGEAATPDPVASVGNPSAQNLEAAQALLTSLPEELKKAAHSPEQAAPLIIALLTARSTTTLDTVEASIQEQVGETFLETVRTFHRVLKDQPKAVFLPLADMAAGGLRSLNDAEFQSLAKLSDEIMKVDGHIDLYEFAVRKVVFKDLRDEKSNARRPSISVYGLAGVSHELSVLLSAIARSGTEDEEEAQAAFEAGRATLPDQSASCTFLDPSASGLGEVDTALRALDRTAFPVRKNILKACLAALMRDGIIRIEESELFRAVAGSMGCPVPVWLLPSNGGVEQKEENNT